MEALGNIVDYIDNMKIKTTAFGGFDKEAVYDVIQDLSSMYQKHISELQRENNRLRSEKDNAHAVSVVTEQECYKENELSRLALEAAKKEAELKGEKLEEAYAELDRIRPEYERMKKEFDPIAAELEKTRSEANGFRSEAEILQREVEDLHAEIEKLRQRILSTEAAPVAHFENDKCSERFALLEEAIRALRTSEEKIVSDANVKANAIISQAKLTSEQMLKEGNETLIRARNETMALRNLQGTLEATLSDVSMKLKDLYSRTEQLRRGIKMGAAASPVADMAGESLFGVTSGDLL